MCEKAGGGFNRVNGGTLLGEELVTLMEWRRHIFMHLVWRVEQLEAFVG